MRLSVFAAYLALSPSVAIAAPPPPPPDYINAAVEVLTANLAPPTFDAYAAIFADDVQVVAGGQQVALNKSAWLDHERVRIGKVDRYVIGWAEGHDCVLVIDQYDDRSALPERPGLLFDPRYKSRAARYQFGPDHRVHQVTFLEADGFWRPAPKGR